jgi:hypothetical protein
MERPVAELMGNGVRQFGGALVGEDKSKAPGQGHVAALAAAFWLFDQEEVGLVFVVIAAVKIFEGIYQAVHLGGVVREGAGLSVVKGAVVPGKGIAEAAGDCYRPFYAHLPGLHGNFLAGAVGIRVACHDAGSVP